MRFETPPQPAPYLSRQDQRRLLGMVAGLSFIMIAILWAARPETWHWLIPPDNESAVNSPLSEGNEAPPFLASQAPDPFGSSSNAVNSSVSPVDTENSSKVGSATNIPPDWLESINDQFMGLRVDESDAYYRILAHVSRLDEDLLNEKARKDILHVNLIHSPNLFRGELISLKGTARRILPLKTTDNPYGVKTAYEVWITTEDSGNDPWRVVTTSLDKRLPRGENVNAPVKLVGYFFKLYSYASNGGQHMAPLILSARVESNIVVRVAPSGTGLQPYIILFAALFGFGTLLLVTAYHQGDHIFRTEISKKFRPEDLESRKVLQEMAGKEYDPTEILRQASDNQNVPK
ncbi:hypothetical protein [Rubinisphaera italica]|uniref:Uncharacterized protein n=1 Tax=Rubinisphaera italica TaxID=2527969 RepID=A0A5C5XMU3_9PLAN|nr:hypothetical protein [Rubinisphaera italica]TWT64477.1 hypothetical protein Pan54_52410 [Rubinisphaera italica]